MQKLPDSSFCKLKLPNRMINNCDALRFFIKSYNESERSYMAVCLDKQLMGRSIVIREKAILEVLETTPAPPDLSKWPAPDVLAYLVYEASTIEAVISGERRNTSKGYAYWENYQDHLSALKKDPSRLKMALVARKQYFESRLVPFHGSKKSRTVMRRLRKKNNMRNDNAALSKNRQKTYYSVPTDGVRGTKSIVPGISTKATGKKRIKSPTDEEIPYGPSILKNDLKQGIIKTKNPMKVSQKLSDVSQAVQDFVSMIDEQQASPWSTMPKKFKKKVKKKKLDIPF
jgi:hypothetical protein